MDAVFNKVFMLAIIIQRTNIIKDTSTLYSKEKLKGIKKNIIKSFVFYYNNYCLID